MSLTMYCGSSARFGSFTIPLRFIYFNTILIYYPLQRGTVAESIVRHLFRDAANRQEIVVDERGFVFGELSFSRRANRVVHRGFGSVSIHRIRVGIRS